MQTQTTSDDERKKTKEQRTAFTLMEVVFSWTWRVSSNCLCDESRLASSCVHLKLSAPSLQTSFDQILIHGPLITMPLAQTNHQCFPPVFILFNVMLHFSFLSSVTFVFYFCSCYLHMPSAGNKLNEIFISSQGD